MDKLYRALPVWAQNVGVSAFGAYWHWQRFGPGYSRHVEAYRHRERFSREAWDSWQHEALRDVLTAAAEHVPYYRSNWDQAEKRAASAGQLADLPLLSKGPVRDDPGAFVREDMNVSRPIQLQTSGSSGTPVTSIFTVDELRASRAIREVRSLGWAGVSFSEPRATFSGRMVVPEADSTGPYWRYNFVERQVYLSAFHLRPDTAPAYVRALWKHRPTWMTGYAVSYFLLAQHILEQHLDVPPLKAVITTSEKVTPEMRAVMEEAYGCRVFEEYGSVENIHLASECEAGRLHVSPDVGIVEVLRPDGTPCDAGEAGEVVVTALLRSYQPFVRYRLGDLAVRDDEPCPCGRALPVLKEVVGRVEDVVTGPDGRQLVRFHGVFVDQPHVQEGQIVQETLERFTVKVVPTVGFGDADIADIRARMAQRLGPGVDVRVECVDEIPRTSSGKFKAVISHIHTETT